MRPARDTRAPGREAYVRLLLTRGVGELSYDPALCPAPSVVIIVKPHIETPADIYTNGARVSLVPSCATIRGR